jgi:hypothetical protein
MAPPARAIGALTFYPTLLAKVGSCELRGYGVLESSSERFHVGEPGPESVGDRADCGRGFDVVRGVNRYDRVADNCERIVRE